MTRRLFLSLLALLPASCRRQVTERMPDARGRFDPPLIANAGEEWVYTVEQVDGRWMVTKAQLRRAR